MPRRLAWHWLLPTLLALALYAITVPGTYTYDDLFTCRDEPRLHDVGQWGKYLHEGYFPDGVDNLWRPLVSYSYALEVKLHGDRPWAFHLVNVLLHGVAAGMVGALGARLTGRRVGLIAGLLFAVHPVHVEAVAGIVGRAEEMALIGVLGALLLFINRPMTRGRAVAIVGVFLLAAFCKEQGLLIPLMLFAWAKLSKRDAPPAERQATQLLVALLTLTMAAYVGYRNHILPWYWERGFLDPALNPLVKSVGVHRWLIPVAVLGRYTELLLLPTHFSLDYGMSVFTPKVDFRAPHLYAGGAALLACVFAFFRLRNVPRFTLICFLLTYFMVSNVVMIGTIMGERLMYLPSAFLCILLAIPLAKLPPTPLRTTLALLLTLAAIRTESYAYQWNTRLRLYTYAVTAQPHASMPYLLLSQELTPQNAAPLLARARLEAPDAPQVWSRSAWNAIALGQLDAAEAFATRSFHLRPGNGDAMTAFAEINKRRASTQPTSRPE